MKYQPVTFDGFLLILSLVLIISCSTTEEYPLAKPSDVQYKWHEQERIMFVAIDPAIWQGREYDNHSIPLSRINPAKLNTDQWCEAAVPVMIRGEQV